MEIHTLAHGPLLGSNPQEAAPASYQIGPWPISRAGNALEADPAWEL